jgi:hypothetical protein
MLVEVMFLPCLNILEKNPYESVSVFATLLMPETDGMTNLVDVLPLSHPGASVTNCCPVPRMPTADEHLSPDLKVTKFCSLVWATNLIPVRLCQWAIVSLTRP